MVIEELVEAIARHHFENPDHGLGCACMDEWIRQLRNITSIGSRVEPGMDVAENRYQNLRCQNRIDYVMAQATKHRLYPTS